VSAAPVSRWRRLGELCALTAFALAQPVLDVTGRSPDFFLYRRATPGQLRLLVLLIAAGPPLALWLAEEVAGAVSDTAARAVHLVFCAVLFAVIVVQLGKHLGLFTGIPLAVVAVVAGGLLAVLFARKRGFRQAVRYATPAPLVFALLFALVSPAGSLVRPTSGAPHVAAAAASRQPPIVFILFDELPLRALLDDHGKVDARLFPNFARLAGTSTWYPNATGVSGWTPYAVPAMLTGRYPKRSVAPSYVEFPQNLFTLLQRQYDMRAFESIAQLCPPTLCATVPAGRDTGLGALVKDVASVAREIVSPKKVAAHEGGEFAEGAGSVADPAAGGGDGTASGGDPKFRFSQVNANQPNRLTNFVEGLQLTDRPAVNFLHLLLPHLPFRYLPSGRTYPGAPQRPFLGKYASGPTKVLTRDPAVSLIQQQRILLQLVYTDNLLGTLLDRMKATGLLDEALLVVTADHGEGLAPDAHWRKLDDKNASDLAWVPLFVKSPRQKAGKVDPRNEEQVDLMPTIADELGIKVPWTMDGRSLHGSARDPATKHWFDVPGEAQQISTATWLARTKKGFASETASPELGPRGLFATAAVRGLYGKKLTLLDVGSPASLTATLDSHLRLGKVDRAHSVPSMLWGDLPGPPREGSRWLAVSVNGTVAGSVAAVQGVTDGKWRFMGLVDDTFFRDGANDVRLFEVDGATLHPVAMSQ
jgi:hypothetical protein